MQDYKMNNALNVQVMRALVEARIPKPSPAGIATVVHSQFLVILFEGNPPSLERWCNKASEILTPLAASEKKELLFVPIRAWNKTKDFLL